MTYRGVDHERLEELITCGIPDEELRAFFKSKRNALIIARDKQNMPSDTEEAIKRMVRFSDKAHEIFGEWLAKQSHNDSDIPRTQLVPRFAAIDRQGVEFGQSEYSQLCRSGLVELYSDSPLPEWLDFLRSSKKSNAELVDNEREADTTIVSVYQPASEVALERFLRVATGEMKSHEIEDSTLRFLAEMHEGGTGKRTTAPDPWPEAFSGYARLRALISEKIKANEAIASAQSITKGVVAEGPAEREYNPQRDYSHSIIIATRSKYRVNKPYFLDVEGFIDNGEIFALSDHDLRSALPEEGRLILFPESGIEPAVGEPLAYHVERRQTEYSIKVAARKLERSIAPTIYVPHKSTEPDHVRQWLKEFAARPRGSAAVFVLEDGLCIKTKVDLQRIVHPEFDWQFDSWPTVRAFELSSGAYVVLPIHSEPRQYDCAPLAVSARTLLKTLTERKAISLTNRQLSDIVGHIRDEETNSKDARFARVASKLEGLLTADDEYSALIEELMKSPVVLEDIERRKVQAADDAKSSIESERRTLTNLRTERGTLEKSIERLKTEGESQAKSIRATVLKAFEAAKAKGIEGLGEAAVWQALTGTSVERNKPAPTSRRREDTVSPLLPVSIATLEPSGAPLADELRSIGLSDDISRAYCAALEVATRCGFPIVVEGPGAYAIAQKVALSISKAPLARVEIPLGLISGAALEKLLGKALAKPLLVANANLSDLSLYAPWLLQYISERFLLPASRDPLVPLVLSGATGPAALPWPAEISQLSVFFNSASIVPDLIELPNSTPKFASTLQKKAWTRLEALSETERLPVLPLLWQMGKF
jgi:hypothetical protein